MMKAWFWPICLEVSDCARHAVEAAAHDDAESQAEVKVILQDG
jgi:hypothetical protein